MFQETTTGSNLSRKGTLLMAEVLHLTNKVLPLSMAAKIQVSAYLMALDDAESLHFYQSLSQMSSSLHQITSAENTG
jgi:large subunit ribosomal protein L17e